MEKKEFTSISQALDPDGIQLSGGMVQKLMLARCIYKDAPILVLDEPTAALDPRAEYEMYQQFNDMVKGKTAVYIWRHGEPRIRKKSISPMSMVGRPASISWAKFQMYV